MVFRVWSVQQCRWEMVHSSCHTFHTYFQCKNAGAMNVFDTGNLQWLSAKKGMRGTLAEISVSSYTSVRNTHQLLMSLSLFLQVWSLETLYIKTTFGITTMKRIKRQKSRRTVSSIKHSKIYKTTTKPKCQMPEIPKVQPRMAEWGALLKGRVTRRCHVSRN